MTEVLKWRYEWRRVVNRDYRLTHSDRRVLFELDSCADPDGTNARPGNDLIASRLLVSEEEGMHEKTVRRGLKRGVELGYIEQTAKARRISDTEWLAAVWRLVPIESSVDTQMSTDEQGSVDTQMSGNSPSLVDISESSVDILRPISGHSGSDHRTPECPDTRSLTPDHLHQTLNTGLTTGATASTSRKRSPARATRIAHGWKPNPDVDQEMRAEFPNFDHDGELPSFIDYYVSRGKSMKDWNATWRNWVRRGATKFAGSRRPSSRGQTSIWDDPVATSLAAVRRIEGTAHSSTSYIQGEIA